MKALMIHGAYDASVVEMPKPLPKVGEVLIRVSRCGICGSDVHAYTGHHIRRQPPLVPGHEMCGVIEDINNEVGSLQPGLRVTILPERGCGICEACSKGWTNVCEAKTLLGSGSWPGAFAEYMTAPERLVFPLPEDISDNLAALAEPLAVAVHSLRQARFEAGQSVLLLGVGGIGSLILTLARIYGGESCIACDLKDFNLEVAKRQGATQTINTLERNACEQLAGNPNFHPVDVAFIAASSTDLINHSFFLTRKHGVIVLVGQFNKPGIVDVDKARVREQTICTSFTYDRSDFTKALSILAAHPQAFVPLVTQMISLEESGPYLAKMCQAEVDTIKTMIIMG